MEHSQIVELQRRYVPFERWNCIHWFNEICLDEQSDLNDPSGDTGYICGRNFLLKDLIIVIKRQIILIC